MPNPPGDLSPNRMMLPSEFLAAGKLLRKSEKLRERWRSTDWGKDLTPTQQRVLSAKRSEVDEELERLSSAVLARQLGLKKYMVVHVRRDSGYEDKFQLLSTSVRFNGTYRGYRFMWDLEGRQLRKNGTLGHRPGGMSIDAGSIIRRRLDGTWVELQPVYVEAG